MESSMLVFFACAFVIPVLWIMYSAFQRWLQYKEKMGQLIAEHTAEKAAQYGSHVERIKARLRVVEQIVTDGRVQTAAQIESLRASAPAGSPTRGNEV